MPTSIKWLGHSTVLIVQDDTWILTDPVLRRRVVHLRRRLPVRDEDWPDRVDVVLISHLHLDHLDLPTLRRLGKDKQLLVPEGAGRWLARRGFRDLTELDVGRQHRVDGIRAIAVPARHSGRRPPFGPTAPALGYVIAGEHTVYFPGDTGLFSGMVSIADRLDVALLPIWGWGPSIGLGHLDPVRAAEAVRRLRPRVVIPIHWGTFYPIGFGRRQPEFLVDPPIVFERLVKQVAPDTEVRRLALGEETIL